MYLDLECEILPKPLHKYEDYENQSIEAPH